MQKKVRIFLDIFVPWGLISLGLFLGLGVSWIIQLLFI